MNAFKNHTTTTAAAQPVPADQVIASLIAELSAAGAILATLHHFSSSAPRSHAMADLKQRGLIDQDLLRSPERCAVLSMAKQCLSQRAEGARNHGSGVSRDLVRRLRTVAGQHTIKAPAIDLEAADHIEKLQRIIDESASTQLGNDDHRIPVGVKFLQVTSSPDALRPDLGDRRFWPIDLAEQDTSEDQSPAVHELLSILEGALADDLVQYHSLEWLARARTAIARYRGPSADNAVLPQDRGAA